MNRQASQYHNQRHQEVGVKAQSTVEFVKRDPAVSRTRYWASTASEREDASSTIDPGPGSSCCPRHIRRSGRPRTATAAAAPRACDPPVHIQCGGGDRAVARGHHGHGLLESHRDAGPEQNRERMAGTAFVGDRPPVRNKFGGTLGDFDPSGQNTVSDGSDLPGPLQRAPHETAMAAHVRPTRTPTPCSHRLMHRCGALEAAKDRFV